MASAAARFCTGMRDASGRVSSRSTVRGQQTHNAGRPIGRQSQGVAPHRGLHCRESGSGSPPGPVARTAVSFGTASTKPRVLNSARHGRPNKGRTAREDGGGARPSARPEPADQRHHRGRRGRAHSNALPASRAAEHLVAAPVADAPHRGLPHRCVALRRFAARTSEDRIRQPISPAVHQPCEGREARSLTRLTGG